MSATAADLEKFTGSSPTICQDIIDSTLKAIEEGTVMLEPEEGEEIVSASAVPSEHKGYIKRGSEDGEDKFSDAERRLREELAAFKLK